MILLFVSGGGSTGIASGRSVVFVIVSPEKTNKTQIMTVMIITARAIRAAMRIVKLDFFYIAR
ncbi:MAG: hypothetical protein LBH97_05295 [Treponema sp.]|nr:hypothetical protein [Treponema sp.]